MELAHPAELAAILLAQPDGSIDRGAQNLPGNWESGRFHLPSRLRDAITGRFLKKGTEKRRPGGTVVERLKSRSGRKK